MRRVTEKFDRWVHKESDRSYHISTNPPKKMVESGHKDCAVHTEDMIDDVTGDPLVKVMIIQRICDVITCGIISIREEGFDSMLIK